MVSAMANEVFITEPGTRIIARKGTIIIVGRNGNKQVLPPNTEEVIIATSKASISTKAIRILATKGTNLVILNHLGGTRGHYYATHHKQNRYNQDKAIRTIPKQRNKT